jgi:hypothetical protein
MEQSPSLVFIIGAGASTDFGDSMPVGSQLATRIEALLHEEFGVGKHIRGPISDSLSMEGRFGKRHQVAADRIRRAIHAKESIDDLLDEWRENAEMLLIGKMAIAHVIQRAECQTRLGKCSNDNEYLDCIGSLRDTWLGQLIRHVQPGRSRRQLAEILKDVGFIVFNYDRFVELALTGELACNTTMSLDQARSFVVSMDIVHPYGTLGTGDRLEAINSFGSESEYLVRLSKGIRTYTEETHDAHDLARMYKILSNARTTVFLGFGYHPKNLSLLLDHGLNLGGEILGACLNPYPARLAAAERLLFPAGGTGYLQNMRCNTFMWDYRDRLFGPT